MKFKCNCGSVAVWEYMPGYTNGDNDFFCENCVPRGCECNHRYVSNDAYHPPLENPDLPEGNEGVEWKWLDENKTHWCFIDEQGREYPCCEFSYDPDGIDVE
jgi:hypothetical protein